MTKIENKQTVFFVSMCILGAAWLILRTVASQIYPTVHNDEVLWGAMATNLLRYGNFGQDVWLDRSGFGDNMVAVGRLFPTYIAAIFLLGGNGLIQARLSVIIATLVSAVALGLVLQKLYSTKIGVVAAILYLFSWNVFYFSGFVRPELVGVAGGLGLIYWVLHSRENPSPKLWLGWGFVNAFLLDTHLAYLHIFIAIDLLILASLINARQWKGLIWVGLGHGLGLIYWLVAHFLPDPDMAWQQLNSFSSIVKTSSNVAISLSSRLQIAAHSFSGQFISFTRLSPFQLLVTIISLIVAVINWRKNFETLLILSSLVTTVFFLIPSTSHPYYLMMLFPWFSALHAIALANIETSAKKLNEGRHLKLARQLYSALLVALFAAYIVGSISLVWRNRQVSYLSLGAELRREIPAAAHLMADPIWFYTFPEARFTDNSGAYFLTYMPPRSSLNEVLDTYFTERKIEYVILADRYPAFKHDSRYLESVERHCHYLKSVAGDLYGVDTGAATPTVNMKIYKCN